MRRYDIDWLRNLGILLLFPFHSARVFDLFEVNYVENAHKSVGLTWFIIMTSPWFMPLLFTIALFFILRAAKKKRERVF